MKLSERLQWIADEIEVGETMVDIGTDHGFLPIYLKTNTICPQVILADISGPSLEKAKQDCLELAPGERFDFRCGDGLQVLREGEVDDVVIAGMGGILITEILGARPEISQKFKKIILQPRSQVGYLRRWLNQNGFSIQKETLVREGKFIPSILVCRYDASFSPAATLDNQEENNARFEYPEIYKEMRNPLVDEYLLRETKKISAILQQIGDREGSAQHEANLRRIEEIQRSRR